MTAIQRVRMAGLLKNGKSGPHCLGREVSTKFARQFITAVTTPPLVGCVVWKLNTGVPQDSKLSPLLFSFYIAGILRPTEPVKRLCYADDAKSSVTLASPYAHQAKTHSRILIDDSQLLLVQFPKKLVYLNTSLSFNTHSGYVTERVSSRNNILRALAGTSCGQQNETLLMTYKAVGRSIINMLHLFGV